MITVHHQTPKQKTIRRRNYLVKRDKIFIIIGLVSLIGIILELFGVISESLGMLFFLGMLMFFFHAVNSSQKNE